MIRHKVTITNPTGLHLRPAGIFCNVASRYKCKVEFVYDDNISANAKSVLSVLGACVKAGDEIDLSVMEKGKKKRWQRWWKLLKAVWENKMKRDGPCC